MLIDALFLAHELGLSSGSFERVSPEALEGLRCDAAPLTDAIALGRGSYLVRHASAFWFLRAGRRTPFPNMLDALQAFFAWRVDEVTFAEHARDIEERKRGHV